MNKEDKKKMEKSQEQILASEIKGYPLSEWEKGKRFLAMSDRTLYVFEPSATLGEEAKSLKGIVLEYSGCEPLLTPDLKEECIILFSDGSNEYRYNTGKSMNQAMAEVNSGKLPLLADIKLAEEWKSKLVGMKLWTKSNLWYDESGKRIDGLKYVPVEVADVCPVSGEFPMIIKIIYDGMPSYLYMNYTSDIADSRNFAAIFFLNDPKNRYPSISDENWRLIQAGKVGNGMSKEECRLALGNPDEIRAGHSTSQTMDIWQYANGTYLFFTDGLLTSYRQ